MAILQLKDIRQLAGGVTINAFSLGTNAVYTAPAAQKVVITKVILRCTAATAVATPADVKVEINPAAGDLMITESLLGVLAVDDQWSFVAEARGLVVPAGGQVDVTVVTAATGTSQTLEADVFGYFVF
ncbi:MAG: hypothetical protein AB7L09_00505 [Nitrospira sp.]